MHRKETHSVVLKRHQKKISQFIGKLTIIERHLNSTNRFDEETKLHAKYTSKALELYQNLYSTKSCLLTREEMVRVNSWWRIVRKNYSNLI